MRSKFIELFELRNLVKKMLLQEEKTTVLSNLSAQEKELAKKFPYGWGRKDDPAMKGFRSETQSPVSIKVKRVFAILDKMGLMSDAGQKKKIIHGLRPFIEKMNPTKIFVSDPAEIANRFCRQVLNIETKPNVKPKNQTFNV